MKDYFDDEDLIVIRKSFVFYDSFYRAMNYLNEEEKIEYIDAICYYSLYDIIIEMSPKIKADFLLIMVLGICFLLSVAGFCDLG